MNAEKRRGSLSALFRIILLLILASALLIATDKDLDETLRGVILIVCLIVLGLTQHGPIRERLACFVQKRKAFRQGTGGGTVRKYEGHLFAYWEHGWEGKVLYALAIAGLDRPFFLESGQRLTIFSEDGSILWSGILCFVKRRWWDQHNLPHGIWSDEKQAGVSYAQWMAWFVREPPLKAIVEVESPAANKD